MRKKKKKRKIRRRQPRTGSPPVRCAALMVVDSSRIRRQSMGNCKRARTTFEKAERELAAYESRDKPAFIRWYRTMFGPRIGEVKSLADQIQTLRMTITRLERFADLTGCNRRRAAKLHKDSPEEFDRRERELLDRLQREKEHRQRELEEQREEDARILRAEFGDFLQSRSAWIRKARKRGASPTLVFHELLDDFCMEQEIFPPDIMMALNHPEGSALLDRYDVSPEIEHDGDDLFEAFLKELLGGESDDDGDGDGDGDGFDDLFDASRPAIDSERDQTRLSFLRRQLAFALHPDQSNSDTDPAKMELWHEVQEAVENRDLDRLEVLYAHCQMLDGELSLQTPVSRLRALTDMYRRSRDALRRRIRALRKEPDWGFSVLNEAGRHTIRRGLEHQLNEQVDQLRAELAMIQEFYRYKFDSPRSRRTRSTAAAREQRDVPGQGQFAF